MKQFPYLPYFLFKVAIAWFQTHYCLVKVDILFKAKANYVSESSETMARKEDTLGVQGGESSPSWGQNDLFMSTGTLFWVSLAGLRCIFDLHPLHLTSD